MCKTVEEINAECRIRMMSSAVDIDIRYIYWTEKGDDWRQLTVQVWNSGQRSTDRNLKVFCIQVTGFNDKLDELSCKKSA